MYKFLVNTSDELQGDARGIAFLEALFSVKAIAMMRVDWNFET